MLKFVEYQVARYSSLTIRLGLSIAAIAAIAAALSQKDFVASVLYCLALMALALALAHIEEPYRSVDYLTRILIWIFLCYYVYQMSAYFAPASFSYLLGTFAVVWWPYPESEEAALAVLSRLAPFERGVYEDHVANFWCTSSVLVKWKNLCSAQSIIKDS
ncbi:hypothetical protein F3Y22_tig00110602pilonHSYRG00038 [Hibiscus syriacus]|uniref:Alpha-1,3-glucosyltransferase n=1 Tax=Hibiscus syriacus TaxID=106335 RepID=A0A6A3A1Z8_HIBSY|nr:hypothetical protein F3Y22_tig00110602pilonHSYRG00038 [Hibiscus syriacus]